MDLPSTFNARRVCYLGGKPFWVRAMPLEGWAEVVAWLDDVMPGKNQRDAPPCVGDPPSQRLLRSDPGRALLAWIALREDGDVTYEGAWTLWSNASEDEQNYLLSVLMARRRTLDRPEGLGTDIGEMWCGERMAEIAQAIGIKAIGALSIDQLEWLAAGGVIDQHADPSSKAYVEACRQWEEANKRWQAEPQSQQNDSPVEAV